MAHHGLVLSEEGAMGSRMLFRWGLGLSDVKYAPYWTNIGPARGQEVACSVRSVWFAYDMLTTVQQGP